MPIKFAVVYSKKDKAGVNIAEQLKSFYLPQIPIIQLNKETIYSERLDKSPELQNIDFIVFASKHKSTEHRKTLSLHAPGNWRNADFGGKPGHVCLISALILKYLFQKLNENNNLPDFECTLECTHHGPYIEKPCCFIEIGSSEEEWQNQEAAKIIAKTIADLQDYEKNNDWVPCLLIGGGHYNQAANKIMLKTNYAVGHIIPEYSLSLTQTILKEAIEKTQEHIDIVILDWKGLGKSESRQKIIELLKQAGLEFKRTSEIEK